MDTSAGSRPPISRETQARIVAYCHEHPGRQDREVAAMFGVSRSTVCRVRVAAFGRRLTEFRVDSDIADCAEFVRAVDRVLDQQETGRRRLLAGKALPGDAAALRAVGLKWWEHVSGGRARVLVA